MKYLLLLCLMFGLVSCGSDDPAPAAATDADPRISVCNTTGLGGSNILYFLKLDANTLASNLAVGANSSVFTTQAGNYTMTLDSDNSGTANTTQTFALEVNTKYVIATVIDTGGAAGDVKLYTRTDDFTDTSCPPAGATQIGAWNW